MKLIEKLKKVWLKWFGPDEKLLNDARKVIKVMAVVKKYVDSPQLDTITKLIPGDVDDAIVSAVRNALDKVTAVTNALHNMPKAITNNQHLMNAVLAKAASTALAEKHSITESDADTLVQLVYNDMKNGAA